MRRGGGRGVALRGEGKWGVGNNDNELWLGDCKVNDQLQPERGGEGFTTRVRLMEWFRFNCVFEQACDALHVFVQHIDQCLLSTSLIYLELQRIFEFLA